MEIKKKNPLLISILLILIVAMISITSLPATRADPLFSAWVFEDQTISAGGKMFVLKVTTDYTYIFLQNNNSSIGVSKEECTESDMMRICFQNTSYDRDLKKTKIKLEISQTAPTITFTRTADKTSLYLGETANITVKIKNTGGYVAENAHYEDSLAGFKITNVVGCMRSDDRIVWDGRLKVNETLTCKYYFYPTEVLEKTTKARFDYVDSEKRTIYSSGISLKTLPVLNLAVYADSEISLGNKTKITINLSSKSNTTLLTSLKLTIPKGFILNQSSYLKKDFESMGINQVYTWNGTITSSNTTSLTLYVQGIRTGYHEFLTDATYALFGRNYSLDNKKIINVKTREAKITTSIPADAKFDEETQAWIKIYAENPNPSMKINNLRIIVDSPLFDSTPHLIGGLNESTNKIVLILKTTMPKVNVTRTYNFNLNSTYQSPFGETFSKNLAGKITVLPIAGIIITTDVSNANPKSEDTITITTRIKNPRNKNVNNIKVYDDATPTTGSNSAIITLNASETKMAYAYKIKTPYVGSEDWMNITTHATYDEDGKQFDYNLTRSIRISKKDLKITATRKVPQVLQGTIFSNTYELSNTLTEEINDIRLSLRKQQGFDLIDSKSEYAVQRLAPGEKISFSLELKSKENKTTPYEGEILTFKDAHGTLYEQNLSGESINVLASSSNSPMIHLEKNVSDTTIGVPTQVSIIVKNTGLQTNIALSDDSKDWILSMPANSLKQISYNKTFNLNGTYQLAQARAQYSSSGKLINSYSQRTSIKVNNPIITPAKNSVEKTKEIKTDSSITGQDNTITPKTQTEDSNFGLDNAQSTQLEDESGNADDADNADDKPGLTQRFIAFIKYIFGY